MKNRLDVKSFVIGFLICLCGFLMLGFVGNSDSGRYIQYGDKPVIIDTKTGKIRPVYGGQYVNKKYLWDTPFEQLPPDSETADAMNM